MDRREFLKNSASVTILVTSVGLQACGKGDGSSTGTPAGAATGTGTGATGTGTGTTNATGTGTGGATGTGTGATSGCAANPATCLDSEGHNHTLTIPAADWAAGTPGNYPTTGGTHNHTVGLSAQNMADLAANCTVTVQSNDSHAHQWVLTIA